MFLTEPELKQLTGLPRTRQEARRRVLDRMGLPYWINERGALVVSRNAVEMALAPDSARVAASPRWDAVR